MGSTGQSLRTGDHSIYYYTSCGMDFCIFLESQPRVQCLHRVPVEKKNTIESVLHCVTTARSVARLRHHLMHSFFYPEGRGGGGEVFPYESDGKFERNP